MRLIASLRRPAGEVSGRRLALLSAGVFVILHLLLAGALPMQVDIDELQYGDFAVLILDGFWEKLWWRPLRGREGFPLLLGPLVTPFFAVFGANLMTLQAAYVVFAGGCAAVWVAVSRRLAPRAPVWAVAGLFILPAPFISRYCVSPMAMSTHLGVSTAFGLTMLLMLGAQRTSGWQRWPCMLLAGLAAGFGVYGGRLMAVLLPGVLVAAATVAGWRGIGILLLGMLPGIALVLRVENLAAAAFQDNVFTALRLPPYASGQVSLRRPLEALLYAPGYPPPEGWAGNYLPAGWGYFPFVAIAYILGRRPRPVPPAPLLPALLVSAACLLISFVRIQFTPFDLNRLQWDAPRYAAPLLPIAAVVVLLSCSRLAAAGRRGAGLLAAAMLVAHAVGFWSHASGGRVESSISAAWVRAHGTAFEPLSFPFDSLPDSARRRAYALRQGMVAYQVYLAGKPGFERWAHAVGGEGDALDEFWRGVGRAHVVWRGAPSWTPTFPDDLPAHAREAVWQGIGLQAHECYFGMEAHACRPEGLDQCLPATAAETAAYAWGWSRACVHGDHVPPLLPTLPIDWRLGRRLRWELDLSLPGAPPVSDQDLERLTFVRWRP